MFSNVNESVKTYNEETQYAKVVFVIIESHLFVLAQNFKTYFLADDKSIASYEWVRDPFRTTPEDLSTVEEEIFVDCTSSGQIIREFSNNSLFEFCAGVDDAFSPLKARRAFRILLPFSTSYLCQSGFSAVAALKTKYRSRLNIVKEMRVAISNIKPSLEKLCCARQAQGSHL